MYMESQASLEARLDHLGSSARSKIHKVAGLQDAELKDLETALELDFSGMRAIVRELESLAEDQEEEEDEAVLGRLQQYKQQYQDIQTDYSKAKMVKKLDPHEENRKLLLAGGDPTKRQRELQSEAELLGAAQSTTGSLQRSRQVMLEQIDNTQTILASMDASHTQLQSVTKEYQGQSDVFGTSKRLLRTLRRHSSWDKLVLYGGFAMLLLVCLYVVQKRSLYFVPTFVKTGLGKLVPTWYRSSGQDVDALTRSVKARGDDPGTEGLRQKPTHETLRNADQAQQLLERHLAKQEPAKAPDEPEAAPSAAADKVETSPPAEPASPDSHAKPALPALPAEPITPTHKEPARSHVTKKQMDDTGHGPAFAKIMDSIPDQIRNRGPHETESADSPQDAAHGVESRSESGSSDQMSGREEEIQQAVAAAVERATEQQQHRAVSLDAGQAYPEHTSQVSLGEEALPQHAALLTNLSTDTQALRHNATAGNHSEVDQASADQQRPSRLLKGAVPDSPPDPDHSMGLQESVTDAIQQLLNSSHEASAIAQEDSAGRMAGDVSVEQPLQAKRQQTETVTPGVSDTERDESVKEVEVEEANKPIVHAEDSQDNILETASGSLDGGTESSEPDKKDNSGDKIYQSETQDLDSLFRSKSSHSVPQQGASDFHTADDGVKAQQSDRGSVSKQQMDESGHGEAFADIIDSIPDHIKNMVPDQLKSADAAAGSSISKDESSANPDRTQHDDSSARTSHDLQSNGHAEL